MNLESLSALLIVFGLRLLTGIDILPRVSADLSPFWAGCLMCDWAA